MSTGQRVIKQAFFFFTQIYLTVVTISYDFIHTAKRPDVYIVIFYEDVRIVSEKHC